MEPIRYWNRALDREEVEKVYGSEWMERFYGSAMRARLTGLLLANKAFSRLYGAYKSTAVSARSVPEFIEKFDIPMNEYEEASYSSFNDFFIRKFKKGARPFTLKSGELACFAEGRYFAFETLEASARVPVKGVAMTAQEMLGSQADAKIFEGGPAYIARLCPVDYHRYHYPDDGSTVSSYRIPGALHSVNPLALKARGNVLHTNERHVSILQTKHFGRLAFIEVGALCVGRIVETHRETEFLRGQEKGYFLFGGSTVVLLGEKSAFEPDQDLLDRTQKGMETLIKLGSCIGSRGL